MYSGKIAVPPGGGGIVFLLKILKTKNKQNPSLYFTFNFTLNLTKRSSFFFALLNVQIGLINVLFVPFASVVYFQMMKTVSVFVLYLQHIVVLTGLLGY
jgi:hypothetical protein